MRFLYGCASGFAGPQTPIHLASFQSSQARVFLASRSADAKARSRAIAPGMRQRGAFCVEMCRPMSRAVGSWAIRVLTFSEKVLANWPA